MNNIEQLLTELCAKDVKVWAENGQLRVSAPKGVLTPALRSELAARKAELLAALGQTNGHAPPSRDILRPAARPGQLPLSFNQQRLWVMEQINPSSAYNQFGALCFEGELNIPALTQSLTEIVRRHEILRTVFPEQDGGPVQAIQPPHRIQLPVLDLTELAGPALEARVQQLAIAEAQQPFDLAVGPLLRLKLLRLAPQSHILFLTAHHICGDGWSGGVLSQELTALYTAYVQDAPSPLPELPLQYADYAVWQRQWMDDAASAAQLAYWKQQLAGLPPLLELPADHPRPVVQRFCGALHRFEFSPALAQKLKALGSRSQTTPFMIGLAAFAILLARYSRTDDIAIGSLIANRSRRELEELIGFFANTLVLRVDLAGEPTVLDLLARVRKMTLAAYDHQELPFEKLVDELRPERSLSYNPLFQVLFTWQSNNTLAPVALPAVTVKALDIHPGTAKFDLHLNLWDADTGGLRGELEYNSDLFEAATITRMAGHLQVLLTAMVENPEERITRLPLLTEAERCQLLAEWNDTAIPYPQDKRLHQWVEEQVMRTPDAVAVTFEGQQLTYRELNERANQLAHHLQRLGVGPDTLVGICVERSLEMVVGLLGILKAGGAYVPLDPTYPAERLAFMLEDAAPAVLLTQHHLLPHLSNCESEVLCLDTGWTAIAQASTQNPDVALDKENLAYMIYTSGSTGRPKGAMNTHGAICNRLLWMQDEYGLTPADSVLQKTPFSFDVSVWEFFWPLMTGARLVVARPEGHKDSAYLVRIIVEQQITTLHFVPSMLQIFVNEPGLAACCSLKRIICSGEALPFALQQRLFERLDVELHNLYGPTEAAVDVTYWACERESERMIVPIGRPVANTQIYLLDPRLQPTPIGVPGELYIGGVQLARGYLKRPELTAEKFVPDPFSSEPGARLYRTGDLARYLPDGAIEYLGRIDFQVKIRGFRIELGEVESVLANHPAIHEIVVVARADQAGNQQLVAYIVLVPNHHPTAGELRDFAQQRLPEYMVPAVFVVLEALPLSSNGKVDRRALPAPDAGRLALSSGFVAASTPQEQLLAAIWAGLLGLERVGIHDNFFELGGDSLRATQVTAKAREGGLNLTLQQLFQHQTVFELARVAGQQAAVAPPLRIEAFDLIGAADRQRLPADVEDAYPMTALQAGMVFHSEQTPGGAIYHDVFSYHLRAPFDLDALRTAIQQLAADHEVLRTSFALSGFSQPLQLVHRSVAIPVPAEDLRHLPPDAQEAAIAAWVEAESRRPFRWDCPPFVRFCVQRRSDDTFNLSVGFHHAILDGWSFASLLTELYQRYFVLLGHAAPPLDPPPALKFRDYVALERESAASPAQQAFWVQQLAGCQRSRLPRWPAAHRSPQPRRGQSLPIPVPADLSDRLHKLAQEAGVPLKSVLLAAHLRVMRTLYNEADVLTGLAAQGRPEAIDSERVKGLFLNTLPFRLQLHGGTWLDLIRATFGAEQEVLPYQRYPLAEVQRALGGQPLLETLFFTVHFHVFERLQELPGFAVLGETFAQQTNFTLVTGFMQDPLSSQLTLLGLDYDSSQLCAAQVRAIGAYYLQTLAAMVANPAGRYESHSLLPAAERQQLLIEWNNTRTAYPHGQTIHRLFEEQATRTPDALAVVFGEERLTYRELNARANQLAHHLMAHGVGGALGAETVVGLCVERSAEMIIGLLGILKAGGAYLPLDPTYPHERLAFMLGDADVKLLLTQSHLASRLPATPAAVIRLDADWSAIAQQPNTNPTVATAPDSLAYVMYTSGSTGQPKGVCVVHRGVVRLVKGADYVSLSPAETMLQLAPITFDASTFEIWGALLNGASLVVMSPGAPALREIGETVRRHGVTTLWLTAGLFHLMVDERLADLVGVRQLLAGGDVLSPAHVRKAQRALPGCRLINGYGPTENTTFTTCYTITDPDQFDGSVPIGRPIASTEVYVLDPNLQPVPVGVPGELYVGGAGLARGYLNRPDLTAERFLPNPYSEGRLYKTGDLARYLPTPDGSPHLEFLGRLDDQVKIRGFRVELGEVEAALAQHPAVAQTAVTLCEDQPGHKQLVAYVVARPGQTPTPDALRAFLGQKLPDYMVPAGVVCLDRLPLTANGKVDRHSLPAPASAQPERAHTVIQPRNRVEQALAAIWADVLGLPQVGVMDDFFDLGGDSLLALRLRAQAERHFQRELPFATLYQNPTVEQLAVALHGEGSRADIAIGSL